MSTGVGMVIAGGGSRLRDCYDGPSPQVSKRAKKMASICRPREGKVPRIPLLIVQGAARLTPEARVLVTWTTRLPEQSLQTRAMFRMAPHETTKGRVGKGKHSGISLAPDRRA